MGELDWNLHRFTIGIRHDILFCISDLHGAMADEAILARKKTKLSREYFSLMQRPDIGKIILTDNSDKLKLTCSVDGIIIQADMSDHSSPSIDEIVKIYSLMVESILPMTSANEKINRIGVIREYQITEFSNSAKTIFSQFMKINLQGIPDNTLIRLALKNPSMDVMTNPQKKGDYKNVILTIKSEKESEENNDNDEQEREIEGVPTILAVSIDYQNYYIPKRNLKDVNIGKHLLDAENYTKNLRKALPLKIE